MPDRSSIMVRMNQLNTERRAAIVRCLVEGCSIRSTVRMTGASKNTITKLLVEIGAACSKFQDETLRELPCRRLQLDEIWSFVYSKAKNVPEERKGDFGVGDVWTWTAICADTKLVPCWLVAGRDGDAARIFVSDLSRRLRSRVQLTTDGHKPYLEAVEDAFGMDVDYAMLIKHYGSSEATTTEAKYSPNVCTGCKQEKITGYPDPEHISTSYAERANLTMRMSMRRFTRLTNAFSKKVENHAAAISLHFMYYNFARIHQTLRSTPAMKAGVANHLWSVEEIVGLLDRK
ncbi:MAG: DDE-type integrase/transposase/recombinase [Planctomycetaceae bacterium]|nr:DDE-type integrase/transposase/recombinase [Planctomycetaceae bacterium]